MSFDLSRKIALITGAAGLLGQQHAVALLKNNATVVLTDVNAGALNLAKEKLSLEFNSDKIKTFIMDVSNKESILNIFDKFSYQLIIYCEFLYNTH